MKKTLSILAIMSAVLVSCQKEESDYVSIEPNRLQFDAEGGAKEIRIYSSSQWIMVGHSDWCTPQYRIGNNEWFVTITAQPNTTGGTRGTSLAIICGEEDALLNISQSGK